LFSFFPPSHVAFDATVVAVSMGTLREKRGMARLAGFVEQIFDLEHE
jgi:hypothetical protein